MKTRLRNSVNRIVFVFHFLISWLHVGAQSEVNTILDNVNGNYFYKVSDSSTKKLIVFLHGGVKNPEFSNPNKTVSLNYIIEGNSSFLTGAIENNFDLLLPITNKGFNWLDEPEGAFAILKNYFESGSKEYDEIYIGGFSDGGTGSYKMFYNEPEYFDGLLVFNGYPQHKNHYKKVDYLTVTDKKIIFVATFKDKTIPYEFLLTEYTKQKVENPNTYIYIVEGTHSFKSYHSNDFNQLFSILNNNINNELTEPTQGFIRNDTLISVYPFRKKIVKKFNFGRDVYEENVKQLEDHK